MRASRDIVAFYLRHRITLAVVWAILTTIGVVLVFTYGHWPTALIMFVLWWSENLIIRAKLRGMQ